MRLRRASGQKMPVLYTLKAMNPTPSISPPASDSSRRMMIWIGLVIVALAAVIFFFFRPSPVTGKPNSSLGNASSSSLATTGTVELVPATAPVEGPFSAKVTIVEFLDYQCPGCGAYHPVMKEIRETFKNKIKFVVRQFPLVEIHQFAKGAAIAAVCSQRQGKFFDYSDVLFQNQKYLRRNDLERYAEEMGLKMDDFKSCLDDSTAEALVIKDRKDGEALNIPGTPTIFINGKILDQLMPPDELTTYIQKELGK